MPVKHSRLSLLIESERHRSENVISSSSHLMMVVCAQPFATFQSHRNAFFSSCNNEEKASNNWNWSDEKWMSWPSVCFAASEKWHTKTTPKVAHFFSWPLALGYIWDPLGSLHASKPPSLLSGLCCVAFSQTVVQSLVTSQHLAWSIGAIRTQSSQQLNAIHIWGAHRQRGVSDVQGGFELSINKTAS